MSNSECPICMDAIDVTKNSVVTDCGHTFHCSCLMQNAVHNGFGCPYCRTVMANEPPIENDEEDEESSYLQLNQEIGNYSLTSFRMFMQRLNGEEPEEEPEDEYEYEDEDEGDWETDEDEDEPEEEEHPIPDAAYMVAKLMERGITYEDLVKDILNVEHSNWGVIYQNYDRRAGEVYGQFRAIISRYNIRRETETRSERFSIAMREDRDFPVPVIPAPVAAQPFRNVVTPTPIPEVAETKSVTIQRRIELMSHV